jgi:hypothetical protein
LLHSLFIYILPHGIIDRTSCWECHQDITAILHHPTWSLFTPWPPFLPNALISGAMALRWSLGEHSFWSQADMSLPLESLNNFPNLLKLNFLTCQMKLIIMLMR